MALSDLPNKELKVIVVNMLLKVRRKLYKPCENFNRDRKQKYQTEITKLKNIITYLKVLTVQHQNRSSRRKNPPTQSQGSGNHIVGRAGRKKN